VLCSHSGCFQPVDLATHLDPWWNRIDGRASEVEITADVQALWQGLDTGAPEVEITADAQILWQGRAPEVEIATDAQVQPLLAYQSENGLPRSGGSRDQTGLHP
jgi:hypothetical protein